ncbi:MAG: hypothetical protein KDA61_22850, partial [Planctomycetales bacterium]|nr:hypothetical protein [Planctomycetales bacterium]
MSWFPSTFAQELSKRIRNSLAKASIATAAGAAAFSAHHGRADQFEWRNAADGFYFTSLNWNNITGTAIGPPGPSDNVLFNEPGSYETWFANDETADAFDLTAGDVTLRSLGVDRNYSVDRMVIDAGMLTLGTPNDPLHMTSTNIVTVSSGGQLSVVAGSKLVNEISGIGIGPGTTGRVVVDGAGSAIEAARFITGCNACGPGGGELLVSNGGTMTTGLGPHGLHDILGGNGQLIVEDPGSHWLSSQIELQSTAQLLVRNQGRITVGTGAVRGIGPQLMVQDSNSVFRSLGDFEVGAAGMNGTLAARNGGVAQIEGVLRVSPTGNVDLPGGTLTADHLVLEGPLLLKQGDAIVNSFERVGGGAIDWQAGYFTLRGGDGAMNGSLTISGPANEVSAFYVSEGGRLDVDAFVRLGWDP